MPGFERHPGDPPYGGAPASAGGLSSFHRGQLRVHSTGMHSGSESKEFFFEEQAVGYFEDQLPSTPGQYRYVPFRGFGHLRLVEALASGSQRCYYVNEGKKHYFIVLKASSHGILLVHAHAPGRVTE